MQYINGLLGVNLLCEALPQTGPVTDCTVSVCPQEWTVVKTGGNWVGMFLLTCVIGDAV